MAFRRSFAHHHRLHRHRRAPWYRRTPRLPRRSPPRAGPRGAGRWRAPARLRRALAPWRLAGPHAARVWPWFPRGRPPGRAARHKSCRALTVAVLRGRARPPPAPRPARARTRAEAEKQAPGQRPRHEEARTGPTDPPACGALAPALWSPRRRRVRGAPRAARPSPRRRRDSRRAYAGAPPAGGSVGPVLAGRGRWPGACWVAARVRARAGRGAGGGRIVARGAVAQVLRGSRVRFSLRVRVRVLSLVLVLLPPQLAWRLKRVQGFGGV